MGRPLQLSSLFHMLSILEIEAPVFWCVLIMPTFHVFSRDILFHFLSSFDLKQLGAEVASFISTMPYFIKIMSVFAFSKRFYDSHQMYDFIIYCSIL